MRTQIPTIITGLIDGVQVELNPATGLPKGMIDGTNEENFIVYRGGWNCRHVIVPVSEVNVPEVVRAKIFGQAGFTDKMIKRAQDAMHKNQAKHFSERTHNYITISHKPLVRVNELHGKNEFSNNYRVMNTFINHKKGIVGVDFLPEIHEKDTHLKKHFLPNDFVLRDPKKNPDAVIRFENGEELVVDFKFLEGNGRRLSHHIADVYSKADYAIVQFKNNNIEISVGRTVEDAMKRHEQLKGVFVFDNKGSLLYEVIR